MPSENMFGCKGPQRNSLILGKNSLLHVTLTLIIDICIVHFGIFV